MPDPGDDSGDFMDQIGKVRVAPRYPTIDELVKAANTPPPPSTKVMPVSLVLFERRKKLMKSINSLNALVMTIEARIDAEKEEVEEINAALLKASGDLP